jgi:hypothetical protein
MSKKKKLKAIISFIIFSILLGFLFVSDIEEPIKELVMALTSVSEAITFVLIKEGEDNEP